VRLFVAVYPPDPVADDFAALTDTLAVGRAAASGTNTRIPPRPFWHVTLAFLGEVAERRQLDVEKAVGEAMAGWAAAGGTAPVLELGGGGQFGKGKFTVLWVGLRNDVAGLRALAAAVRGELRRARLPFDDKPMRPHLTVARPGDRVPADGIAADRAVLDAYHGPQWTVDGVHLVRSHLGPKPRYDRLGTWRL
jgi:2'-5' RNA ligase